MKSDIADLWIADLRANPDKQGTGHLCAVDKDTGELKYCCLGRLGLVLGMEFRPIPPQFLTPEGEFGKNDEDWVAFANADPNVLYIGYHAVLTDEMCRRSEIQDKCGHYDEDSSALTSLNDSGVKFEELADIIDKQRARL